MKRSDFQPLLDRFVNRNTEGLPTLQIGGSQQFNQANPGPSTPTFGISGQKSREAMMSRVEALGRGAISQSAAAAAAASSTGLKRLFANVVEQAKEGAAKKEGKPVLPKLSSTFSFSLEVLNCHFLLIFSPIIQHLFSASQ